MTFTAIPDMLVEDLWLEVMNRRIDSDWKPATVRHGAVWTIDFVVPHWVNAGSHAAQLVAVGAGFKASSPLVDLLFPQPF